MSIDEMKPETSRERQNRKRREDRAAARLRLKREDEREEIEFYLEKASIEDLFNELTRRKVKWSATF